MHGSRHGAYTVQQVALCDVCVGRPLPLFPGFNDHIAARHATERKVAAARRPERSKSGFFELRGECFARALREDASDRRSIGALYEKIVIREIAGTYMLFF